MKNFQSYQKSEFYFVRHGQTDHNLQGTISGSTHNVPLNATGRSQSESIISAISQLPVATICHSPLLRAKQTMEIAARGLQCPSLEVDQLKENCCKEMWKELLQLRDPKTPPSSHTQLFFDQAMQGLEVALQQKGPILIFAHGGVHWALCHQLGVVNYEWDIGNCHLAHFMLQNNLEWTASLIT